MANPLDVEQSAPLRRRLAAPNNNDLGDSQRLKFPEPSPGLPARHPLNILKRSAIMGGTLYVLHELKLFHNILHSPSVSHGWFKIGIASTIALLAVKAHVELYEGKLKDKKVEYENFKSATHWAILLIFMSWTSFHMALSPVYGTFKTWLIMCGFGYGILIQGALFIPVWGQNAISFIVLTFFLQTYK
ncbi:hypothetical protein ACHAXA_000944 [Cyclostephanos tholiformis]|uniref:Uncharacterized protein n=1 Tax=Cyclostephanos tholiformis TaxID=382380 RepID=A0ABD3R3M0_9STRA